MCACVRGEERGRVSEIQDACNVRRPKWRLRMRGWIWRAVLPYQQPGRASRIRLEDTRSQSASCQAIPCSASKWREHPSQAM
eukprot:1169727-Pleurochrysis_carterae.AAC.5